MSESDSIETAHGLGKDAKLAEARRKAAQPKETALNPKFPYTMLPFPIAYLEEILT